MKRPVGVLTFTLVFASLLQPTVLFATPSPQAPGLGGPHGSGPEPDAVFLDRMAETLDLTEAQITEIEGIMRSHRIETAELRSEAHIARDAVRDLAEREVFDEEAVRAAEERLAAAHVELAVERARLKSEIHAVLTPEQGEKAADLRSQREEHRAEKGHRWQKSGPRRQAPRGRRR